ncbi:MAG TPA: RidA family protein [Ktedonobacterales bacterium]|nr:RidA family protein [Ktedonobacterales bacterium]
MSKQIINPAGLPEPRGFNHGVLTTGGRMLFLAGQDASDGEGRIAAPGDILAQCQQVLHNLHAVVHEAGGVMSDIVKLNVYVTSRDAYLAQLKPLGKLFREYFGGYYPAMALFEVAGLFQPEALIEMEGFAMLGAEAEEQG